MSSRKPIIHSLFLTGRIEAAMVEPLSKVIMRGEPCVLVIDSGGGDVLAGEALSALVRDNERVAGLVVGRADSMAIAVLQSCFRRIALPSASFLFHSICHTRDIMAMDMWDKRKVEDMVTSIQEVQERYWTRLLRRVKAMGQAPEKELTEDVLRTWCGQEARLSAEEVKAYGLLDDVRPLADIMNLTVLGL